MIVIGAGISGLACAKDLRRHGVDVHILEARDRIGGRLYTVKTSNGVLADVGGQFIGPTQYHMHDLANELSIDTYDVYCKGNICYELVDQILHCG